MIVVRWRRRDRAEPARRRAAALQWMDGRL